jgi:hypothetical protein
VDEILNSPWVLCGAGILFCVGGIYLFFRNIFEEDRQILQPLLIIVAGIILISIGTAKYLHLA